MLSRSISRENAPTAVDNESVAFAHKQMRLIGYLEQTRSLLDREKSVFGVIDGLTLSILKLGQDTLVAKLEETSISRLLASRLKECASHLDRLRQRICDKSSRVLVTGDLNAGKSTLINALLGAEVLPYDQQPCTMSFCEVVDVSQIPAIVAGVPPTPPTEDQCVHAISKLDLYDPRNSRTYESMTLSRMQAQVQQDEQVYSWFRIFWSSKIDSRGNSELLRNGLVDVSLIDSPGLNSDAFKTMSLFSRQEDIDVVVFVINAANHLTQSAREFLQTAGREKAYIFIVVNKFDDIRNREKCRRMVLQQIGEVLPLTLEAQSDLIHFVSATKYLKTLGTPMSLATLNSPMDSSSSLHSPSPSRSHSAEDEEIIESFQTLERGLCDFILAKRAQSKLLPAKTYMSSLLEDLGTILVFSDSCRRLELSKVEESLETIAPLYAELVEHEESLRSDLRLCVNDSSSQIYARTEHILMDFVLRLDELVETTPWPGIWAVWSFRFAVASVVHAEATHGIEVAQRSALESTVNGMFHLHGIAASHSNRVFATAPLVSNEEISKQLAFSKYEREVPALSRWDVLDPSGTLWAGRSWLGATTLAAAFFGYQPLLSLTFKTASILRVSNGKLAWVAMGLTAALVVGSIAADFQAMVRRRLRNHYHSYFGRDGWVHGHAQRTESAARQVLTAASASFMARFQEALHNQQALRAEKDRLRQQIQSRLCQFAETQRQIDVLLGELSALAL